MFPLFHVLYSISIHNKFFCTSHDKSIPCWSSKHLIWHYGTNFEKSTTTLRVWRGVNKKWSQQLPLLPCIPPLTRQHEDSLFYPSLASVQPTILLPSSSLVYIRKKHKTWTQRGNYGYVAISALDKIAQYTSTLWFVLYSWEALILSNYLPTKNNVLARNRQYSGKRKKASGVGGIVGRKEVIHPIVIM